MAKNTRWPLISSDHYITAVYSEQQEIKTSVKRTCKSSYKKAAIR